MPGLEIQQSPQLETVARSERFSHPVFALNYEMSVEDSAPSEPVDLCANPFTMNTCETPLELFILKDLREALSPLESALMENRGWACTTDASC